MHKLFIFIVAVSQVILNSCAVRSVYVPTSQNTLLFDSCKQIQVNAYVGLNHYEGQAAFNPRNHFAFGTNTNYGTGLAIYEGFVDVYNYSKRNASWRYELIGGAGYNSNFSEQNNSWLAVVKNDKINYETQSIYGKYFLQPAVGFFSKINMYKMNYSFSFSCRTSFLDFKKYVYREIYRDSAQSLLPSKYLVNRDYTNKSIILTEPCFINKIGIKNVNLVVQSQFIVPLYTDIDLHYANLSPVFLMSFGLQYNFIFKKRKTVTQ